MPVIRIKESDKLRIDFMKGYLSISSFITSLLDKAEQPKEDPEPRRENPSIKKKETHPLFGTLKDIYITTFENNNRVKYTSWSVIDAQALNKLIKQLEVINESNKPLDDLFAVLMDKLPNFYRDKKINAINNNLSTIISEIKNGNSKDSKGWDNIHPDHDWRR